MKKGIWIAVVAVFFLGYIGVGPFLAMSGIKSGIETKDSVMLSEHIDFQSLRQNLKDQFNAKMIMDLQSKEKNNPFGALAAGFASKLVDGIVDGMVTPAGLAQMISGKAPSKPGEAPSQKEGEKVMPGKSAEKKELFENARFGFDSTSKFSIWVPTKKEEEVRFLLVRNGLDWKLSNIIIPM